MACEGPALRGKTARHRRARACPSPVFALRGKRHVTVGRGPVPRQCSRYGKNVSGSLQAVGPKNITGQWRSRGTGPRATIKKRGIAGRRDLLVSMHRHRRALPVSPTGRYRAHLCNSGSPEPEQVRIVWQICQSFRRSCPTGVMCSASKTHGEGCPSRASHPAHPADTSPISDATSARRCPESSPPLSYSHLPL